MKRIVTMVTRMKTTISRRPNRKNKAEALFLFLVKGHLTAMGTEFADLHLRRVETFVAGRDVIFVAAFTALKDDLIALAVSHLYNSLCLARWIIP